MDSPLIVRVRLFGRYRDLAPGASLDVALREDGTVADLVEALHRLPLDAPLPERPVVAVNHRPAPDDASLSPDDEVALIPPVAGG